MRTARNMLCLETPKCRRMTFHRLPHPLPKELGLFASSAETEPPADVGLFAQVLKESCRVLCDVDNVQGACEKGNGQGRERKTWRLRAGSEATTSRGVVDTAAGNARCSCFYLRRCLAQMAISKQSVFRVVRTAGPSASNHTYRLRSSGLHTMSTLSVVHPGS